MTNLMQRLHDARPTVVELERMWPADERDVALDRILANGSTRRPRRRAAWLAAAAVTGALIVVPSVMDSGSAAAQAELRLLARAAGSATDPMLAEGTYLHVKTEAIQHNSSLFGDGKTLEKNREEWVRWDGKTWAVDSYPSRPFQDYNVFPRPTEPYLNLPTPEFAAALPDDPGRLRAYLDEHVSGSNSHDEAVFVAVIDLARSHFLPPRTLAAALEVLADVNGVDTRDVTVSGRPAVEVTYSRFWGLISRDSAVLDRATGQVIAEHDSDPGGSYDLTTTLAETVDAVPAAVRQRFQQVGDGARVPR